MPTPLYYCPAIHYGATTFWLPPWLEFSQRRGQTVNVVSIPNTSSQVFGEISANQGTRFSLKLTYLPPNNTPAEILSIIEQIWTHMSGRQFTFFLCSDRGWPNCALEEFEASHRLTPWTFMQGAPLHFVSLRSAPDTGLKLTFTDFDAEYPYAGQVGRWSGNAVDPGEEIPIMSAVSVYAGAFAGIVQVATGAGEDQRIIVGGAAGARYRITGLQISAAEPFVSNATTKVTASTVAKGTPGGGQQVTASVAQGQFSGALASAAIEVTAGDSIYVYIPDGWAGSHQNVTYQLHLLAL